MYRALLQSLQGRASASRPIDCTNISLFLSLSPSLSLSGSLYQKSLVTDRSIVVITAPLLSRKIQALFVVRLDRAHVISGYLRERKHGRKLFSQRAPLSLSLSFSLSLVGTREAKRFRCARDSRLISFSFSPSDLCLSVRRSLSLCLQT